MTSLNFKRHEVLCTATARRRLFAIMLLLTMTVAYYLVIYAFSARTSTYSTKESNIIVKKVVKAVESVKKSGADRKLFTDVEFVVRKLAHFTNFFIFGFLCIMLASAVGNRKLSYAAVVSALLCGLAGAALDEWHQLYVPGRSAEIRDVCVDFAGISTGCLCYTALLAARLGFENFWEAIF